ncbi:Serpin (serine protease inhibitor) (plasmid) [Tautonia plasticadhaerens]|uniref:Serpin (Serine protease inhibitor) n=1 Tax=Tautonia plasticadhaerens TaxID=2527974 RepID=A0A518HEJ1_9BACT|nr:Serpin (serine protease inhibitor) [Tautonia plasticadhaerens]
MPMMSRQGRFRYAEGDGLKLLELPYGEGDLAMVVLLPDEVEGLAELEARLTAEDLDRWLSGLGSREVQVSLPRFTMRSRFKLAETLESLGMTLAFSPGRADFSGMASQDALSISQVVHEGFVDVNEEGTEATAATGVVMTRTSSAPSRPVEFRDDHPFLFLIRDSRTGSILFLGRLKDPQD